MKEENNKGKAIDMAVSQIERLFGKGAIMKLGEKALEAVPVVSTGSIGLDIALGAESPWAVSLGARYLPGDVEFQQLDGPVDDTNELGFNIWSFTAGVAYRF